MTEPGAFGAGEGARHERPDFLTADSADGRRWGSGKTEYSVLQKVRKGTEGSETGIYL